MVPELCLFALVTNTSATFVYTAGSAVLWERTNSPFEEEHVIWILFALPVCAWADAVQQDDLVKVSGEGRFAMKFLRVLWRWVPALCVFFKISSHIRCSSLGRFCLGCFFWSGTLCKYWRWLVRVPSGMVLKMKSMGFSGTVEQKYQLFSVSYLNWLGFLVLIMRMNYMLHYDKLVFF